MNTVRRETPPPFFHSFFSSRLFLDTWRPSFPMEKKGTVFFFFCFFFGPFAREKDPSGSYRDSEIAFFLSVFWSSVFWGFLQELFHTDPRSCGPLFETSSPLFFFVRGRPPFVAQADPRPAPSVRGCPVLCTSLNNVLPALAGPAEPPAYPALEPQIHRPPRGLIAVRSFSQPKLGCRFFPDANMGAPKSCPPHPRHHW